MRFGRDSLTPVAFVCDATTDRQRVLESTLGNSVGDLEVSGLKPPAIVVVGDAVKLRKALDWRGALDGRELEADPLDMRSRQEAG